MKKQITITGFQHLMNLKKLEEFHFYLCDPDRVYPVEATSDNKVINWIYSYCAQTLPNLKRIKIRSVCGDFCPAISGTSNLEAIDTEYNLPAASLPRLKQLMFRQDIEDENFASKLCSYRSLTHLTLNDVEKYARFLELIGTQLSYLKVGAVNEGVIDLYKILHLCPNLVTLFTISSDEEDKYPIVKSRFKELVSSRNFRRLEEITLVNFEWVSLPSGLFKFIFLAPCIRKIIITNTSIEKEECAWLRGVDEGRFQRLEEVYLAKLRLGSGCFVEDVGQMVEWLVCGAASLKSVIIKWNCHFDPSAEDEWCKDGAVKFIELLK